MQGIIFNSYAKLNLFLHITGRREDGYHLLESAFCGVTFGDTVEIQKSPCFNVNSNISSINDENNLAQKAARIFFEYTGLKGGVNIFIKKRIPMRSGLGGGSSNAAGTLIALNELFETGLTKAALARIGLTLGADIPFFIYGHPAYVTGIGEEIAPIKNGLAAFYLVIKPEGGVDTKACFNHYDTLEHDKLDAPSLVRAIETGDLRHFTARARNDLTRSACVFCPDIVRAIEFAYASGALLAQMTGSGSAVYAMFKSWESAVLALPRAKELFPFACVISARDTTYEPVRYLY